MFSGCYAGSQLSLPAVSSLSSIFNTLRNARHSVIGQRKKSNAARSRESDNASRELNILCEELGLRSLPGHIPSTLLLEASHASTDTFFENKHGFPEKEGVTFQTTLQLCTPILSQLTQRGMYSHFVLGPRRPLLTAIGNPMARGFKTKRSTASGVNHKKQQEGTVERLGSVFGKKSQTIKSSNEFGKLLEDTKYSTDVQDKIRLAFAEGYAAHTSSTTAGNSKRWAYLVLLRNVFLISLALYLIILLAPLFRVEVGGMRGMNMVNSEVNPEEVNVNFSDIRGADEAKEELQDIVDFLKDPTKFSDVGAKLPKGVLLVGPPGVGKTLLARAVAGEADVPFFHASGSDFDEMFVGTGAKRVRQLFAAAKHKAPCVIFIDEIDTVGAKRTSSVIHPYANQTINQLLSEMDGFEQNEGVIILGATNKREHLDEALLRPGRFDVEVVISRPDLKGRKEILKLYTDKVKCDDTLDINSLAKGTTGFSGADIQNLVNQAALRAALDNDPYVTKDHFEYAKDKVLMGPAKKNKIVDPETNWNTAYHEAGHTLVAFFTKDASNLHKVTIVPRGHSLGHTSFIPEKEEYSTSRSQLLAEMDVLMGGRVAEEIAFGTEKVTTGASSDFATATSLATAMVKKFGMSEKVGVRVFRDNVSDSGLSMMNINELSPALTELIDSEIKRLLQESYERAKMILKSHQAEHKALASALMKYETLDAEDIKAIVAGKTLTRET